MAAVVEHVDRRGSGTSSATSGAGGPASPSSVSSVRGALVNSAAPIASASWLAFLRAAGAIATSDSASSSSIHALTVRARAIASQSGAPHEWPRWPRQSIVSGRRRSSPSRSHGRPARSPPCRPAVPTALARSTHEGSDKASKRSCAPVPSCSATVTVHSPSGRSVTVLDTPAAPIAFHERSVTTWPPTARTAPRRSR